jgi:hypothetical protein
MLHYSQITSAVRSNGPHLFSIAWFELSMHAEAIFVTVIYSCFSFLAKESCGSEAGGPRVMMVGGGGGRGLPRRGEIRYSRATAGTGQEQQYRGAQEQQQYRVGMQYRDAQEQQQYRGGGMQYSSQDSLPDSPYSSQSLDSHTSQGQGRITSLNS